MRKSKRRLTVPAVLAVSLLAGAAACGGDSTKSCEEVTTTTGCEECISPSGAKACLGAPGCFYNEETDNCDEAVV